MIPIIHRCRQGVVRRSSSRSFSVLVALLFFSLGCVADGQPITFDEPSDPAWGEYAPLNGFGGTSSFVIADGVYQLSAMRGSAPDALGPARAASYRRDRTFDDFYLSVDLLGWESHDQAIGLLARVSNVGLGTLNGYAFTYSVGSRQLVFTNVDGETPTNLATAPVTLEQGIPYRLVFQGVGTSFTGAVFSVSDPGVPLASLAVTDVWQARGWSGIVIYDNTTLGSTRATFDNYVAAVPEPGMTGCGLSCAVLLQRRRRRNRLPVTGG